MNNRPRDRQYAQKLKGVHRLQLMLQNLGGYMKISLGVSFLCKVLGYAVIGVSVKKGDRNVTGFFKAILEAIRCQDFTSGAARFSCPDALPFVSTGIGLRTANPDDYVIRRGDAHMRPFLRRQHAIAIEHVQVLIYTVDHYRSYCAGNGHSEELAQFENSTHTHVLMAVNCTPGSGSICEPERFVSELADGNRGATGWTAKEIRAKAAEVEVFWCTWCVVAD